MTKASLRDLRYGFKKIERLLRKGEEIQIIKGQRVIGRLLPETTQSSPELPDFRARVRAIYGDKVLIVSGAALVREDRS